MASVEAGYESAASPYDRDRVIWLGYGAFAYLLFLESSLGRAMPAIRADLGIGETIARLHCSAGSG